MMNESMRLLQNVLIWAIPILFAVTVHEVAHGWVASKLGDKTALLMGRITLNPFKHIDLIGTIIVPLVFLMVGGFIFGWAKPVPVDWRNLRNPRRDMALVAVAGPIANLIMVFIWACVAKISMLISDSGVGPAKAFVYMGLAGISINIMLMILNLIPIPPLDGSRVLASFLSRKWAMQFDKIEPFGFMILVLLIFSGLLMFVLSPIYEGVQTFFYTIFAI